MEKHVRQDSEHGKCDGRRARVQARNEGGATDDFDNDGNDRTGRGKGQAHRFDITDGPAKARDFR